MGIFAGSRYEGVEYVKIIDTDGKSKQYLLQRKPISPDDVLTFNVHWLKEKEELDLIADEVFADGRKWWIIAEVNEIDFPFDLEAGTKIIIPTLDISQEG